MNVFCICQKIAALEVLLEEDAPKKEHHHKKDSKKKVSELEPSKD